MSLDDDYQCVYSFDKELPGEDEPTEVETRCYQNGTSYVVVDGMTHPLGAIPPLIASLNAAYQAALDHRTEKRTKSGEFLDAAARAIRHSPGPLIELMAAGKTLDEAVSELIAAEEAPGD